MVMDDGYTRLTEYTNARTKVQIECPKGHLFEILPNNWRKGVRCGVCYRKSLKNSVVNQCSSNLQQDTSINLSENELYTKYIKLFVKFKRDGVAKVITSDDKRQFSLECRGRYLNIWVMDKMNDDHPNDIYPIYLDVSDYKTDEDYLKEWMMSAVRGE